MFLIRGRTWSTNPTRGVRRCIEFCSLGRVFDGGSVPVARDEFLCASSCRDHDVNRVSTASTCRWRRTSSRSRS